MIGSNYNRPTITNVFHAHFRSVLAVQFLDINRFNNFRLIAQLFRAGVKLYLLLLLLQVWARLRTRRKRRYRRVVCCNNRPN